MIPGLLIICAISAIGSWLTTHLGIPVPGAILGLLALTAICLYRGKSTKSLDRSSQLFTLLIPLLIMPSCIGIMEHWHLIKKEWIAISVAIMASLMFTLLTTPWLISKLEGQDKQQES